VGSALGERPSPSRCYPRAVNGTSTAPNGTIGMPSRAAHHHIDLAAAAAGADQPLAPIEHGGIGAIPGSHLGGIGLDLRPREPKSRMTPRWASRPRTPARLTGVSSSRADNRISRLRELLHTNSGETLIIFNSDRRMRLSSESVLSQSRTGLQRRYCKNAPLNNGVANGQMA
jgi:hypothetical protein